MEMEEMHLVAKDAIKVVVLILLIFGLWFSLVWVGMISCNLVPGGCDIYWGIKRFNFGGEPRIIIAYGSISDPGLGDPYKLQELLNSPQYTSVRSRVQEIDSLSLGNLQDYDLIIVTKAKNISTEKLKMFQDFVNKGGRLVWTGDAGTGLKSGDKLLQQNERTSCDSGQPLDPNADKATISPWARKLNDECVSFDKTIGLEYLGLYCDFRDCRGNEFPAVGVFDATDRDHRLVLNIRPNLRAYGNFALVKTVPDTLTKQVLTINFGGNVFSKEGQNLGSSFPMVVTATVGERVVYYAIPPEMLMSDKMPKDEQGNTINYSLFFQNMYYFTLH
jgi:hypothetical protein